VPAGSRLTITTIGEDPRGAAISAAAAANHLPLPGPVTVRDLAFVEGELGDDERVQLAAFLADPLLQTATWDVPADPDDGTIAFEITYHPGVTDTSADAILHAARQLGVPVTAAATGRRIEFPPGCDAATVEALLRRVVANAVIERWAPRRIEPVFHPGTDDVRIAEVIAIRDLDDGGLAGLNAERALALDPEELQTIRDHFAALGRDPTDVELETLAQTWSEHCSHKTFRAALTVDGVAVIPLLDQLRDATDRIGAKFVRSAFAGNAGIVSFTEGTTLALKAETHNHPSAVEPFGGANTGVGGVIRDVLGAGHRPFAVTDVFCFGPPDLDPALVPEGALHPRRIRQGVVAGVADYGNKIGLPTVAGAVLYDPEYTTNPLVYCGCIGRAAEVDPPTGPHPGDRVVVIGGRTGRDGIRGATFSSAAMDATTGEVAGASVQIGDPVTEKLLIDVLDESARLWTAITDCGAGGLSSAVGEMAEHTGADVELDLVALKYTGLAPWEIWLSEAQERMVLAVDPADVEELRRICDRHRVEIADIGEFTGGGRLVVRSAGNVVLDLDAGFLHGGRPQRRLAATAPTPGRATAGRRADDAAGTLLALLAHPNIASKAAIVHRYDHEILGATLVRPLAGADDQGHADGVVLGEPDGFDGIAVGIGVNPWYGLHDPRSMAEVAVDEAIRNVVAVGADPERVALLDNFSWGDPLDPATLGALVDAVDGCCAAAESFGAPFVSGKDSLNNTYATPDGRRRAVPPTLVVTAIGHVPDVGRCVTPELHAAGHVLVVAGGTGEHFAGSHLDLLSEAHRTASAAAGIAPQFDPLAPDRYRRLHRAIRGGLVQSCHDVAEGGLAVALAEMCIASGLGAEIESLTHDDVTAALFAESAGRLVVEVAAGDLEAFRAMVGEVHVLGSVSARPVLTVRGVFELDVSALAAAFVGEHW
jgi:phosphoribosylformylglycinamidine synthase subunit PurSL